MKRDELEQACRDVIGRGLVFVALVVPRPPGKGLRMHLAGKGSPLGGIGNWTDNRTVCLFRAAEVLAWLGREP
jgi:hypothetical protein